MTLLQWLTDSHLPPRLDQGQGLVEYALILIFVAVVLVALLTILGPGLSNIYQDIVEAL